METLYQRLKEEVIVALEESRKQFPTITESIEIDLKNNYWVFDLKYGTYTSLVNSVIDLGSLYEYFND